MKIDIYTLLGMIKDGKAPNKIIYDDLVYDYENGDYINFKGEYLFDEYVITDILNNEVIIQQTTITYKQDDYVQYQPYKGEFNLKPQEPTPYEPYTPPQDDKIEKLQYYDNGIMWCMNGREITDNEKDIIDKINEIINKLNKEN